MVPWTCQICYANKNEPFQYRCAICRTTYRPHKIEQEDPSNLEAHRRQITHLRRKIQMIGRSHHDGIKFQDPTFERHFSENIKRWCRPRTLFTTRDPYRKHPWKIYGNPDMLDIEQRKLANCWLIAAISHVASKPHVSHRLVVSGDRRAGVYGVTLFINGCWHYIIIDDKIPCFDKYCTPTTMEVKSKQLWPFLVEKALAKFNGSYKELIGGPFAMAMTHLTGCGVQILVKENVELTERELFDYLKDKLKQGFLCGLRFSKTHPRQRGNLHTAHAYQLLDVKDFEEDRLLVKLRNPWGDGSWTGKWNQRDKKSWSTIPEKFKGIEKGPNHMGIFWIHIKHVLNRLCYCVVGVIREKWIENACNGRVYDQGRQRMYTHILKITQPTKIDLFLWETDLLKTWRNHGGKCYKFVLQKKKGSKLTFMSSTIVAEPCFFQSLSQDLEPGTYYVNIFTSRIQGTDAEAFYTLRSLSDKKVELRSILESSDKLAELVMQVAMAQGKRVEGPDVEGEIYTLDHRFNGFDAIVAINNTPDCYMVVMTDAGYKQYDKLVSSRGSFLTRDFLAPYSLQVLNTIGCVLNCKYTPRIFSKHHEMEFAADDYEPPLTRKSRAVHHAVDLHTFQQKWDI